MFVAWLPALGVSPRVCLALNCQRWAAGGGRSLAACLALFPGRAGSRLGWELAEVFGGQSRAEQPVCGRVGVPLRSERTAKAEGTESQRDAWQGTCWCPSPSAVVLTRGSARLPKGLEGLWRDWGRQTPRFGDGELVVTGDTLHVLDVAVPATMVQLGQVGVPSQRVRVRPHGGWCTLGWYCQCGQAEKWSRHFMS